MYISAAAGNIAAESVVLAQKLPAYTSQHGDNMSDAQSAGASPQIPPPQTWVHGIARAMIRPLINTPVTPNHLTTLRLLLGLAAALAFAHGAYLWQAAGGAIFIFSALLDRADGELARLSGRMSKAGHRYDLFSDGFSNVAAFVGIGVGLRDSVLGMWAPWLGLLAGLAVAGIFIVVMLLHNVGSKPGVAFNYPHGFDFDDALFVIGPVAWLNGLLPLIIAAAIGAPLFLLFSLWRYRVVTIASA